MSKYLHPKKDFGAKFHDSANKMFESKRLRIVILITFAIMIVEGIGGFITNSLALLSDAGHMLTHLFSLLIAFAAIKLASKPTTKHKTFGYHRAEILAAFINGLTIVVIVGFIWFEAIKKFIDPEPVAAKEMFIIAAIGLAANLLSAFILRSSSKKDMNVKVAYLHLLSDTISSIAIVIGGIIILKTGFTLIDPILASIIGLVILYWGINLLRESSHILMQSTPKRINLDKVCKDIKNIKGVKSVHDAHIWELSSNMYTMTGHIITGDIKVKKCENILGEVNKMLEKKHNIGHTNFQFECK
jgi:cobalt-zinc-cadmium efflux system protein